MITRRIARWFDDRLAGASLARTALAKVFPDHWTFMLGEIALYSFIVLVATGVFLTLFFEPSLAETAYEGDYAPLHGVEVSAAFASTLRLSFDVPLGLLMRQVHHWAALVFVAAIVAHLLRIFLSGAFRRPRELNWVIGLTMLLLGIANGFTGYSLPDDLLSGVGLRIAYSIVLSVPVAGSWLAFLLFGGEFPAESIIHRMYVTHILIVPVLLAVLITAHLGILVRQKHTQFPGAGRTEHNVVGSKLWPSYALRSLGLLSGITAALLVLGGLVQINPVWLWGPFHAAAVTSPAQPDWYVGWLEGALRVFPPWELRAFGYLLPNPFYPAVLMPALTFLVLYLWPYLEARVTGDRGPHQLLDRPRDHPGRVAFGAWRVTFYGLLLVAGSNDVIAALLRIPVGTITVVLQWSVLIVPLLAAGSGFVLARALRDSGAEGLLQLSWEQLRTAFRPRRPAAPRPSLPEVAPPPPVRIPGDQER